MDFTGIDISAVGCVLRTVGTTVVAIFNAVQSDSKA